MTHYRVSGRGITKAEAVAVGRGTTQLCYVSRISSLGYFLPPRTVNRELSKPENY
jgi:hypothetical protein